ncbi:nucleotide exchange factor GrpE [Nocardioides pakistanensis]
MTEERMEPQDESMPSESAEAEQEESRVAALEQRVAELEDLWRRALAELDNYRKRTTRELARARRDERAKAAAEWLPVIDNLDLALEHARADPENIVEGVRAVRQQALAILAALGYPRRDDEGIAFDPTYHEAVSTVEDEELPPGTVARVVRPGYGSEDEVLRPAAVVVATRGR